MLGPEASLPFLPLSGGSSGVQLEQIAVGPRDGTVGMVIRNAAATGEAQLLLDANNQNGVAELKALGGRGRAAQHPVSVHELQHHQRPREFGH